MGASAPRAESPGFRFAPSCKRLQEMLTGRDRCAAIGPEAGCRVRAGGFRGRPLCAGFVRSRVEFWQELQRQSGTFCTFCLHSVPRGVTYGSMEEERDEVVRPVADPA